MFQSFRGLGNFPVRRSRRNSEKFQSHPEAHEGFRQFVFKLRVLRNLRVVLSVSLLVAALPRGRIVVTIFDDRLEIKFAI
jgi:hypothetical protein